MTHWLEAAVVNLVLGTAALALRLVRLSGYVAGVLVGFVIYLGAGRSGFAVLLGFFVLGSALTRLGYAAKAARGVAEAAGGRRGAANAVANTLVGILLAAAMGLGRELTLWADEGLLRLAYTAAFATAAADTSSSEIGGLWGRHPISLRTLRRVPVGTEGAVSLEGTLAGIAAALALGLLAWALGWIPPRGILVVGAAGTLGNLAESVAASWGWKHRGHHQMLNLMNTLVGALLAVVLAAIWR
jgi:uncharacterized protein (TIGR00297 family)